MRVRRCEYSSSKQGGHRCGYSRNSIFTLTSIYNVKYNCTNCASTSTFLVRYSVGLDSWGWICLWKVSVQSPDFFFFFFFFFLRGKGKQYNFCYLSMGLILYWDVPCKDVMWIEEVYRPITLLHGIICIFVLNMLKFQYYTIVSYICDWLYMYVYKVGL